MASLVRPEDMRNYMGTSCDSVTDTPGNTYRTVRKKTYSALEDSVSPHYLMHMYCMCKYSMTYDIILHACSSVSVVLHYPCRHKPYNSMRLRSF